MEDASSGHPTSTTSTEKNTYATTSSTTTSTSTGISKQKKNELAEISTYICTLLKERHPQNITDVPPSLHPLPPFINKDDWTILGDAIKIAERPTSSIIPGDKYISLRCDGTGFSKYLRILRREGIFPKGFSQEFATIMCDCVQTLMTKFHAKCGYTQSDEMTVILEPQRVIRDVQQPHNYNGRVQKLCSLAAATVTARFNHAIMMLGQQHNVELSTDHLVTFDCRVGSYDSLHEALSLLFWRSYDCGINGTADAVFHSGIDGCKKSMKRSNPDRIKWLHSQSLLPLSNHQRDGTFYVSRKRLVQAFNPKTQEEVLCLRKRIEHVEGNVLDLFQKGTLLPPDEVLQSS